MRLQTNAAQRTFVPQAGIFALGTAWHAYLEHDIRKGVGAKALVDAIVGLREPRTKIFRRNMPYGTVTRPLTGAYYFIPSLKSLAR